MARDDLLRYTNLMAKENLEVATRIVEWGDAGGQVPAAAAPPPARAVPAPGDQADRRGARHLPGRPQLQRGGDAANLRLLRPAHHGDSSLSACVQSVIASAVGYEDKAVDYFVNACSVDLADAHGNTADGIHIASCGEPVYRGEAEPALAA